jgi:glucose-1-phosphate thymidylyltransferase
MKGVILAGGLGTRLHPMTLIINKHLLPVYDRPMIYYPVECLLNAGIDEIMIVTNQDAIHDLKTVLTANKKFSHISFRFEIQNNAGGIADALLKAESFAEGKKICVILGDNIIERNIFDAAENFKQQEIGAKIIVKSVRDPERFGVAYFSSNQIEQIVEKPQNPQSTYAVTGIYFYDSQVFHVCKQLKPSQRGELEITDVNNFYLRQKTLTHDFLLGWWIDAGTISSMFRANTLVSTSGANNTTPILVNQEMKIA